MLLREDAENVLGLIWFVCGRERKREKEKIREAEECIDIGKKKNK